MDSSSQCSTIWPGISNESTSRQLKLRAIFWQIREVARRITMKAMVSTSEHLATLPLIDAEIAGRFGNVSFSRSPHYLSRILHKHAQKKKRKIETGESVVLYVTNMTKTKMDSQTF